MVLFAIIAFLYSMYNQEIPAPENESNLKKAKSVKRKIVVLYNGEPHDITEFAKKHPGGKAILVENMGKEVSQLMADIGHSEHAYELLNTYKNNK